MAAALLLLAKGSPQAVPQACRAGWAIERLHDTESNTDHLALQAADPRGACWGLYLLPDPPLHAETLLIEAPHPRHDLHTPEIALDAYRQLQATVWLLAGSHRFANRGGVADVTRNGSSLFHLVHAAFTHPGAQVVQFHGFAARKHPGYPAVFVSNGTGQPNAELLSLVTALRCRGESAAVYDGPRWPSLSGHANLQGQQARSVGARFYHLELSLHVRLGPSRFGRTIEALSSAIGRGHAARGG